MQLSDAGGEVVEVDGLRQRVGSVHDRRLLHLGLGLRFGHSLGSWLRRRRHRIIRLDRSWRLLSLLRSGGSFWFCIFLCFCSTLRLHDDDGNFLL